MEDERLTILIGNALDRLRELPDASIHMCATSPPYWGLRSYCADGSEEKKSEIGLEESPEEYVSRLVEVFREVKRVLRPDGILWANWGDSYHGGGSTTKKGQDTSLYLDKSNIAGTYTEGMTGRPIKSRGYAGFRQKDLVGIPWRMAFALQEDGWWLRQEIVWAKGVSGEACAAGWAGNPMPESVTDRFTKAHESIFLLTREPHYFFDAYAVKELAVTAGDTRHLRTDKTADARMSPSGRLNAGKPQAETRNRRSVWTVSTQPYKGAHFATWPESLVEPMILAGTSAKGCCPACGAPWAREVERTDEPDATARGSRFDAGKTGARDGGDRTQHGVRFIKRTTGWRPTCACPEASPVPCRVLDPFAGSGTTGAVALKLGRAATLIELNPSYADLIRQRCQVSLGLPGMI